MSDHPESIRGLIEVATEAIQLISEATRRFMASGIRIVPEIDGQPLPVSFRLLLGSDGVKARNLLTPEQLRDICQAWGKPFSEVQGE